MRTTPTHAGRVAVAAPEAPPPTAIAPSTGTAVTGAGQAARQLAAAILEVLAGMQTPSGAARGLGLSLARYYQLEGRALAGLVAACESRRRGRQSGNELTELRRECERLRRECARQQALVRATRRTVGLAEPLAPSAPAPGGRVRRRRRPVARALRVVAELRANPATAPPGPSPSAPSEPPGAEAPAAAP
jgi:hypothetical protein